MATNRIFVPGSQKKPLRNAKRLGAVDPQQRIEVTVVLRRRPGSGAKSARRASAPARVSR